MQRYDINNKPISLHKLIIKEPEWAESRIVVLEAENERIKKK